MANGSNNGILLGILIGGALAGASAIFLRSKSGRALKHTLIDGCQAVGDCVGDAVDSISEKTESLREQFSETADEWQTRANKATKKARRAVNNAVEHLGTDNLKDVDSKVGLVVGALLGGAITIGVSTWLASRQAPQGSSIKRYVSPYLNELKQMVNHLSEVSGEYIDNCTSEAKEEGGRLQEAMDFALAGAKLWRNMKKR